MVRCHVGLRIILPPGVSLVIQNDRFIRKVLHQLRHNNALSNTLDSSVAIQERVCRRNTTGSKFDTAATGTNRHIGSTSTSSRSACSLRFHRMIGPILIRTIESWEARATVGSAVFTEQRGIAVEWWFVDVAVFHGYARAPPASYRLATISCSSSRGFPSSACSCFFAISSSNFSFFSFRSAVARFASFSACVTWMTCLTMSSLS